MSTGRSCPASPSPGSRCTRPAGPSGSPAGASPTFRAAAGPGAYSAAGGADRVRRGAPGPGGRPKPGSSGRRRHRVGPMARHRGRHRTTTAEPRSGRRLPSETGWLGLRSNSLACATRLRLISARIVAAADESVGTEAVRTVRACRGHPGPRRATQTLATAPDGPPPLMRTPETASPGFHQTPRRAPDRRTPELRRPRERESSEAQTRATTRAREESTAAECGGDATRLAIPAGAGSTRRLTRRGRGRRDDKAASHGVMPALGPSPRVRGDPSAQAGQATVSGPSPRGVGSTAAEAAVRAARRDHARGRGEHPRLVPSGGVRQGPSPRVRGAPRRWPSGGHEGGTIPAGAGSTVFNRQSSNLGGDHPRGCGEHQRAMSSSVNGSGPSPRVRGARGAWAGMGSAPGTIPAGAGSTAASRTL